MGKALTWASLFSRRMGHSPAAATMVWLPPSNAVGFQINLSCPKGGGGQKYLFIFGQLGKKYGDSFRKKGLIRKYKKKVVKSCYK